MNTPEQPEWIDVVSTTESPPCPTCGGECLLSARVRHQIERTDGHLVNGTSVVVLCPRCDADSPTAGPLITFFHVHGVIDETTVHQSADLIHAWTTSIRIPQPDIGAIDDEAEAWRRGEL